MLKIVAVYCEELNTDVIGQGDMSFFRKSQGKYRFSRIWSGDIFAFCYKSGKFFQRGRINPDSLSLSFASGILDGCTHMVAAEALC